MPGWVILALLLTLDSTLAQSSGFNHVRSPEARLRELINEGYARSATFRDLVDATEQLPCIVYYTTAVKLPAGATGELLHTVSDTSDLAILRVLVEANLSPEEAIATIAHELQHVTEAARSAASRGRWDMSAAFDQFDPAAGRETGARSYETEAAMKITRKVRDELQKTRRSHESEH